MESQAARQVSCRHADEIIPLLLVMRQDTCASFTLCVFVVELVHLPRGVSMTLSLFMVQVNGLCFYSFTRKMMLQPLRRHFKLSESGESGKFHCNGDRPNMIQATHSLDYQLFG